MVGMVERPLLSVVVPTCDRLPLLRRCLQACRGSLHPPPEIIVVDGCSRDGTAEYLAGLDWVRVIREQERGGATRAFNLGFRAARGRYLAWLNDDAYPLPGSLAAALDFIRRPENRKVGLVAMYHTLAVERNWADRVEHQGRVFGVFHVRGTLYANFGLGRRELFEELGYWDEGYYLWGGDPDFSLKVWERGLEVRGCRRALIVHEHLEDRRKRADLDQGRRDNQRLFRKWRLPPKNLHYNDFDPRRPCTLRGRR